MLLDKKTHNSYTLKFNQSNHVLRFGRFGIKVLSFGRITEAQFDLIRRNLSKLMKKITNNKKTTKFWVLKTCNLTLTKLSSESRMGKGKGSIYAKAVFLKPGNIIFEFDGLSNQQIREVFHFVNDQIPIKITVVKK